MKKLTLLFLVLILKFAPAKAQWVTIPDANFVTFLNQNYPNCMNGNQMDTTCAGIVNDTVLYVRDINVSNLFGVQYFDNLRYLGCYSIPLTSLPALPNSLFTLSCSMTQLSSLPTLPNTLINLSCSNNLLSSLPNLPNSLTNLYCYDNQLTSLPTLPNSLTTLSCSNNQLGSLPTLPNLLTTLICFNNQLSSLPTIPTGLIILNCHINQLISLPVLPSLMEEFTIHNNNISCLGDLPYVSFYADISNNPLTCVPNQTNYSLGLPLCMENDPVNNPNNCPGVNITGYVYADLNGNCYYNSIDLNSQNIPVKLYDNQDNFLAQSFTFNGVYSFNTLLLDTFQIKIDTTNFPVAMSCGQSSTQSVILSAANQTIQNINFPVMCNTGYDVYVQSVTPQGWVFPGQTHNMRANITDNETWYNLDCNN
ncbi:MAG: hypothetical protein ACOYNH_03950, partial [Bacteroidia bacterium]